MDKSGETEIDTCTKQEGCNDCPEIPVIVFGEFEYGIEGDQDTSDKGSKTDQQFYKIPFMMTISRHIKFLMVNGVHPPARNRSGSFSEEIPSGRQM